MGRLIIVSAPSGTGKTVVINRLLERTNNMIRSVSVTTREPRKGEVDGRDYFFITPEKYLEMMRNGDLLEGAVVHGNHYGTPKQFIDSETAKGNDVVLVIDVQGAEQIRRTNYPAVYIFLKPPSLEELENRLRKRGSEDNSIIARRLQRAREEMEYAGRYDRVVINENIDTTVERIREILAG